MRTRMMPQSSGFDEMPIPPALILPCKGEEISPFPFTGEGLVFTICSLLLPYGYQVTRANRIPPARYIVIGVQRALALVGAQWLARFVRDPEVYITVSKSEHRRGVAQWLATLASHATPSTH